MTRIEHILQDAQRLSVDERKELIKLLAMQVLAEADADEAATGERGLAALTESTRNEDWSAYYPEGLGNGRRGDR